jgi:deazaflavin-dependent oxidoreductase (nitroreductase family)
MGAATGDGVTDERGSHQRRLLGLRRSPGRLALAVFRMPLHAYRHGAGWLFGGTFLAFTHARRKTGQPHEAIAMVLRHDAVSGEAVICAAWGPETDWYRNLRAAPAVQVQLGRDSFAPAQRFLSDNEAFGVGDEFRRAHPYRLRLLSKLLGWGDLNDNNALREFVRDHPLVAFRPPIAIDPGDSATDGDAATHR